VEAFNRLGLPLKIAGTGSEMESLRRVARPNVEVLGRVSDAELAELYSRCMALVFPQEEDFGIVPLEAMAAGRPVIAYRAGGALETVREGETGVFFDRQEPDSLVEAVRKFDPGDFDPRSIRRHALRFDSAVFKEKFSRYVRDAWERFQEESAARERRGRLVSLPSGEAKKRG
jgi:glycosyltransferase involved in cell wall biosynthesis